MFKQKFITIFKGIKNDLKNYFIGFIPALIILFIFNYIFGQVCLLKIVTGFPCPFCGYTRAVLYFMSGNFKASFYFQPLTVLLIPIIIMYIISKAYNKTIIHKILKIYILTFVFSNFIIYAYRMTYMFPNTPPLDYFTQNLISLIYK